MLSLSEAEAVALCATLRGVAAQGVDGRVSEDSLAMLALF